MRFTIQDFERQIQPTNMRKTTCDGFKDVVKGNAKYLMCPEVATNFTLPLAGATLSGPLISVLPLGPLGPILGFLVAAFGRFKLRQEVGGSYYAFLHAAGMSGLGGQMFSILSYLGLGTMFGSSNAYYVTSAILSTGGLQAPTVGLLLTLLANFSSLFGILPAFIGGSAASFLFYEVKAYALHSGMKWSLKKLDEAWKYFVEDICKDAKAKRLIDGIQEDKKESRDVHSGGMWEALKSTIWKKESDDLKMKYVEELDEWEVMDIGDAKTDMCGSIDQSESQCDPEWNNGGKPLLGRYDDYSESEGYIEEELEVGGVDLKETVSRNQIYAWLENIDESESDDEESDESDYENSLDGDNIYDLSDMERGQILQRPDSPKTSIPSRSSCVYNEGLSQSPDGPCIACMDIDEMERSLEAERLNVTKRSPFKRI